MLRQSDGDVIRLLPALPDASLGDKVTDFSIRAEQPGKVTVYVNRQTKTVNAGTDYEEKTV